MPFLKGNKPTGHRPKGSTTKPRISDYMTKEDIDKIVATAKRLAMKGNEAMIKLILEQYFGKAPQQLDMTQDGKPIQFVISKQLAEKNGIN